MHYMVLVTLYHYTLVLVKHPSSGLAIRYMATGNFIKEHSFRLKTTISQALMVGKETWTRVQSTLQFIPKMFSDVEIRKFL